MTDAHPTVFTIGHSTHPAPIFIGMLKGHQIESLVDVRAFPGSRRHPQFNKAALAQALEDAGVAYYHMVSLGGRRKAAEGTEAAGGGRDSAFSAYADYMKTASFREALDALETLAGQGRVAIMCAEANWRQCHRSLITEALLADGFEVVHIMPPARADETARSPELPGL